MFTGKDIVVKIIIDGEFLKDAIIDEAVSFCIEIEEIFCGTIKNEKKMFLIARGMKEDLEEWMPGCTKKQLNK